MSNSHFFSVNGDRDNVLLVSGQSIVGNGTGLFLFDGEGIQKIDSLPTAGIYPLGTKYLGRLLCSDAPPASAAELLIYDEVGVERYVRVPELADAHDICWDGESIVCVATGNNKIMWISPSGDVKKVWNAPGENDAWHLNGIYCRNGKTYLSAFGIFARHREWDEKEFSHSGIIYNLSEGRVEIGGLDCPHNPVLLEEGWLVCNSKLFEILNLDSSTGVLKRSLQLNGWTRGLAYSDDYYFVGESANRKQLTVGASANLCVIDRQGWEVKERFAFPITEITFITLVPRRFVPSLRRAFRTNPFREAVYDIHNLFRNTGPDYVHLVTTTDPLPMEAFKVKLQLQTRESACAGEEFPAILHLENLGTGILASTPPCPVHFVYSWFEVKDGVDKPSAEQGQRPRLPRALPPHHSLECTIKVRAPQRPGTYRLYVTLAQEFVASFDQVDPSNACAVTLKVHSRYAVSRVSSAISEALKAFSN